MPPRAASFTGLSLTIGTESSISIGRKEREKTEVIWLSLGLLLAGTLILTVVGWSSGTGRLATLAHRGGVLLLLAGMAIAMIAI